MAESKETIKDRFRSLLNLNKSSTSRPAPTTNNKQSLISDEFWLDIGASAAIEQRIEKMKEAMKLVECEVLQDSVIKKLWIETKDLLQSKTPHELRIFELSFVRSIIKGQYRRLGILRAVFFQALLEHTIPEDGLAVIQTFETLSDNGKDVELFEQEVGPLLLKWLERMKGNVTLLTLIVNVIKFNSSYLDQEVFIKALALVCDLCGSKSLEEEKELGLQVVDAIICYSSLPHESLYSVTVMLCHTLNMKTFCNESWKLMRKLLGTHLGHSCVSTMCQILQNPQMLPDWPLLRSAVFFIGMGLWGSVRVKSLKHTAQSVLPSFHCALHTKNLELAFEVTLTIQRLVRKFGHELQAGAWDHVLDIVISLLKLVEENSSLMPLPAAMSLKNGTHELITFIEKLIESEVYNGPVERLFALTDRCSADRPDESVFMLIAHKSQAINPTKQNWIPNLLMLLSSFYTKDTRSNVRLKTLEVLHSVMEECMELYEEELVTEVLTTCFNDMYKHPDLAVKTKAVQLVVHACLLTKGKCAELFCLLEGNLNSVWEERVLSYQSHMDGEFLSDIEEVALGLIAIFQQKMGRYPGDDAVRAFQLIVTYLKHFYSMDNVGNHCKHLVRSRTAAFELLLSLRANEKTQICSKNPSSDNSFSAYIHTQNDADKSDADSTVKLSFTDILECVLLCLRRESWWPVLNSVFIGLCGLLQNKCIVVGVSPLMQSSDLCLVGLDNLVTTLCSFMSDSEITRRKIVSLPPEFTRSDIQASVLTVLSCLVSYHHWLEVGRQRQILRCLESGFTSRCASICIGSLTLCLAEMPRDSLLRVLPSVLLRLSQMSATVHLATAVLELLATLAQLPGLYCNFVEDQYMSVFAVALQYTNPSKFSRYVVSLAHYVIGTWFAKCRMNFRPEFVSFITRNLHAVNRGGMHTEENKSVDAIRNDLMETCIDMMARYTFSNCSASPRRSPLARFLFDKGPTATWLLGNKLITITTSRVETMTEKLNLSAPPPYRNYLSAPWPKPTASFLERQLSSEAPGKLQSGAFRGSTPSARQRHKSGGAVLRRAAITSPYQPHLSNSSDVSDSTKKRIDFNGDVAVEPRTTDLQNMLTQGWAEIYIRRPSGNTSWSMRIQNQLESAAEGKSVEDILNLQSILNEIKARETAHKEPHSQESSIEFVHDSPCNSHSPQNDYLDVGSSQRSRSASNPNGCIEDANERKETTPETLDFKTPSASGSIPPPLPSSPPIMRHRSHTVSTSKDCAAEAAATTKRAAERKRHEEMSNRVYQNNTLLNFPTNTGNGISVDGLMEKGVSSKQRPESMPQQRQAGISSPCFVFLQLFQSAVSTETIHRPILLPTTPGLERGIQVLDRIMPYDTWATGVVYVGPEEGANGNAILANESGSPRYQDFLQGLGELVCLTECDPSSTFLSGLDTSGEDGKFTYVWKEDLSQMVFHVATLIPTKLSDPGCKKRHIGNDYVIVAYDDDKGRYVPGCVVQGQFRSAEVVITPLDHETNHVRYVFHQECVEKAIGSSTGPWLISDQSLPVFVRQLALHASMAAFVCLGEGRGAGEYTSKALARLKQIKRIRSRAVQEVEGCATSSSPTATPKQNRRDHTREEVNINKLEEFSDYVR